jgi:hypothetical protein
MACWNSGRLNITVHEDGCAKPCDQPVGQPAGVSAGIVPAVTDEKVGHGPATRERSRSELGNRPELSQKRGRRALIERGRSR